MEQQGTGELVRAFLRAVVQLVLCLCEVGLPQHH